MGVRSPVMGQDLLEITLRDGLYKWESKYPKKVEDKSLFDILTNPPEEGVSVSQPEKIFIWATSSVKGKLWRNRTCQVAVNDPETRVVYIADHKQNVTYWVDIEGKTLTKIHETKEGYRHTDKIRTGYTYIGEISYIVNQFTSNGFVIKE